MKKLWQNAWFKAALLIGGVVLAAMLSSIQMSGYFCLFENSHYGYFTLFPVHLLYFGCWGLLFIVIRGLCNMVLERTTKWYAVLPFHLGLGAAVAFLHLVIVNWLLKVMIAMEWLVIDGNYDLVVLAYRWITSNIYIYIAIAGFLHFFFYFRKNREKELRASQLETQMAQIRLQSLRMQLQPHFLFNALNTISAYVKKNPDVAIKMTARLSDLLRLTLETGPQSEIRLEQELRIVENYLEIERLRFADRLTVEMDIDPDARHAYVPAMLLQPLVENAMRHGISQKMDGGTLRVAVHKKEERLDVLVADDGPGTTNQSGTGIGLNNIRQRLQSLYGRESEFTVHSEENVGFSVHISFPFKTVQSLDVPEISEEPTADPSPSNPAAPGPGAAPAKGVAYV